ncbi:limonene-1,2-epoxide hydrolase family protein [Nocardia sp. NPDC005745]|uniref:limonene-1,2-epoxide hydrolase family protein n=1 Tax=Nocardia sp. NPDC005745 TaxID=3157061 RepID=UPI0033C20654
MMMSPDEVVRSLADSWNDPSRHPDAISKHFAEDARYHNIPMEPILGRAAIRDVCVDSFKQFDRIHWDVKYQVASGNVVMNERVDTLQSGERVTLIRVMGVFEVNDGLIIEWRDYFDMAELNPAFGQ